MNSRISDFIRKCGETTYPEPRSEGHDHITQQMIEIVAPMIPRGGRILDVGCGQGPALEQFKQRGFAAIGITTNIGDIDACVQSGYEIDPSDMHEIPNYWDNTFDCVWARHVLEHSPIPFFVLHEFNRVLKSGGVLYVEVPDPQTPCKHWSNPNHYSVLTLEMWQSLISRAGFTITETRRITLATAVGMDAYLSFVAKK